MNVSSRNLSLLVSFLRTRSTLTAANLPAPAVGAQAHKLPPHQTPSSSSWNEWKRERVREWENFSLPSPQSGRRELKLNIDDSVREKRLAPNGSAPLRSHPLPSSFQLAPWAWSWLIAANLKLNASRHLCLFSSPLCSLACFLIIIHPSRLIELSFFLSSRIAVEMLLLKLVIWST